MFRRSTLAHQKIYPPLSQRDRNEFDRLDPNTRNIDNPPEELEFSTQPAHTNSTVRAVRVRFAKVETKPLDPSILYRDSRETCPQHFCCFPSQAESPFFTSIFFSHQL